MATLALHYDLAAARSADPPGNDEMTGLMIDHAELLGWNQGFDPEDRDTWTWQVNEVTRINSATGVTYSIHVTLPQDRSTRAPWAGIATCAHTLLERWGLGGPARYSFGFDVTDTALRQTTGSEYFSRVPASPGAPAGVSLFAAQERPGEDDFLTPLMTDARDVVTGPSLPRPNGAELEKNAPALPEFHGTAWNHVATLDTRLREWSPLLVGTLASRVMFEARQRQAPGPLMLHLHQATTPQRQVPAAQKSGSI